VITRCAPVLISTVTAIPDDSGTRLPLVLEEERDEAEHVQREASGVFAGDDQTVSFIGLISFRHDLDCGDADRTLSQSVSYSVGRWWANSGC
jgi:hypothetical protein